METRNLNSVNSQPYNRLTSQLARWLTDAIFYLAILFFIIGYNFSDRMAGNWYQQFMPSIGGRNIVDITFEDSLNGFAITNEVSDTSFVIRTSNGGDNWFLSHFDTGVCTYYNIQFINQNTGFVSGYLYNGSSFRIVKTTNGGVNWSYVNFPNDIVAIDMFVLNQDTIWLVDSGSLTGGVFFTSNGGASWQNQLFLGNQNPNHVYMFNGRMGFIAEDNNYLRKTTNSGLNWDIVIGAKGFRDMFFVDSLKGWSAYDSVRVTTNGGLNWQTQALPSGPGISSLFSTKFTHLNSDTIWLGGGRMIFPNSQGRGIIFRTINGGQNWLFQIPDTSIVAGIYSHVQFVDKNRGWANTGFVQIHTTTGGDPVWITGINQISTQIPKEYKLFQNYPNPFNPRTVIPYKLKKAAFVRMIAYEITGKETQVMVNQWQQAGEYEVDFMGKFAVSSGIYFYRMEVTDDRSKKVFSETKKMVLLK